MRSLRKNPEDVQKWFRTNLSALDLVEKIENFGGMDITIDLKIVVWLVDVVAGHQFT